MKILFVASLLLLSLTQIASAGLFRGALETDAYKFQIAHGVGKKLKSIVVCSLKNDSQAQAYVLSFNSIIPITMTVDSDKLYIYCSGQTIYSYDLVSHKLDPDPLMIEDVEIANLVILDGLLYVLTKNPSLNVYDLKTDTVVVDVDLQAEIDHQLTVKEGVVLLNDQGLEHYSNNS